MAANAAVLLAELSELVKSTVERSPGSTVRDRILTAAKVLRLSPGRVTDWYYGEVRRVEAWEDHQIRELSVRARESELKRLERQLDRLRAEIAQIEPLEGIRPASARHLQRRYRGQPRRVKTA